MKLYLLVEGISSEMQAYPVWLKYFIPVLTHHDNFEAFKSADEGFHLISGHGYPSIITHINNAAGDVNDIGDIDYFFVILDCDEDEADIRKAIVEAELVKYAFPDRVNVEVVIQNRCFETLLLANRKAIPRQPTSERLINYVRYYDVVENDPEAMGHFNDDFNHAQFHAEYANKALREKRIRYTKSNCGDVATVDYIQEIDKRINDTNHLQSFAAFIQQLKTIQKKINSK